MIGSTVLHYEILELLGRGAMGSVYKALDTRLDTYRALKFIQPDLLDLESAQSHFLREARTQAKFVHPNVATLHELEITDDQAFLVLEYIDGPTLDVYLAKAKPPLNERLGLILQVAGAIASAHSMDILHRDIKPRNVLVSSTGVAKVTDFGLAKALAHSTFSRSGGTKGTAPYMAPEAFKGEKLYKSADVWSLGVLAHEVLEDSPPFIGESFEAVAYCILHEAPPPLSDRVTESLPGIADFIGGCLEKDSSKRIRDGQEAFSYLQGMTRELGLIDLIPTSYAKPLFRGGIKRVRRWITTIAAAVLLALAFFLIFQSMNRDWVEIEREWVALSGEASPTWNESGDQLALIMNITGEERIYILDTSLPRTVPEEVQVDLGENLFSIKWSPVGPLIVIEAFDRLLFLNIESREVHIAADFRVRDPCWASDGRWLVFMRDNRSSNDLMTMGPINTNGDITNSNLTTHPLEISGLPGPIETINIYNPTFIANDSMIAFTADRSAENLGIWTVGRNGGKANQCIETEYDPWVLDWDSNKSQILFRKGELPGVFARQITSHGLPAGEVKTLDKVVNAEAIDLHPSTRKIAIKTSTNWVHHIWHLQVTSDVANNTFKKVIDRYRQTFTPTLSVDQQSLLFSAVVPDRGVQLKSYDILNGTIEELHPYNPLYNNEHSPIMDPISGRYIVYNATTGNVSGLFYFDKIMGSIGVLHRTLDPDHNFANPSWSLDGNSIYCVDYSLENRTSRIVARLSLDRTGGDLSITDSQVITRDPEIRYPLIGPDEKFLLYQKRFGNNIEIWALEIGSERRTKLAQGNHPALSPSREDVYYFYDDKLLRIRNWPAAFLHAPEEEIVARLPPGVTGPGTDNALAVGSDVLFAVLISESIPSIKIGRLRK